MLSVELDLHKRYSQVEAIDEGGQRRAGARLALVSQHVVHWGLLAIWAQIGEAGGV